MSKNIKSETNIEKNQVEVSVIVPVLNEEDYIHECISSMLSQDYPREKLEIIFVDGSSEDGTVEIIRKYIEKFSFIKVLQNPHKTVQYALNIGIMGACGKYIVRMDAHAEYATDYISKSIEYLENTDAQDVGGPMIAKGRNPVQSVVAAAYHSPFALGGGKFHIENFEGYADTVFLGAFRRDFLIDIGLYDERLPRSEDDDLTYRMAERGAKVYITPEIKSIYYPRDKYTKLFKQYYEYGLWKVAVIKKHKKPARISHIIPMLFVLYLVVFGILSIFFKPIAYVFAVILLLYLILDFYFSFTNKHITVFIDKLRLVYVHFILHLSYGLGFWQGVFKFKGTQW